MSAVKLSRRHIFYPCLGVFSFILCLLILYICFPYQKMLHILFREAFVGNDMQVSIISVTNSLTASASQINVGHSNVQGKPIFEIQKVRILWNPFSIFKGTIDISSRGDTYGGVTRFSMRNIPLFRESDSYLALVLHNINLAKYPKDVLPWFKSMGGILNGTIQREIRPAARERQKVRFFFTIKDGILGQIKTRDQQDLTLQFEDLILEGKGQGDVVDFEKIVIRGRHFIIKGNGLIKGKGESEELNLSLTYESSAKDFPLSGKGVVTVLGHVWSPEISIKQGSESQTQSGSITIKK